MHDGIDLTQIALIVLATLSCGLLFERFKQPAVLGYILGGVILSAFNLAGDRNMITALAELGVIMLLFLVGMELSLRAFKRIWLVSLATALVQLGVSLVVVLGIGKIFSLSSGLSVVLAFSIALSSTAVAIKMLESIGELRTETGRVAVGVLIAQDLLIVPLILIIRGMGGDGLGWDVLFKVALAVGILLVIVFFLSRREKLSLPFSKLYSGHEDLQPLAAMLFCFGMASLSGVLGLSAAYGAFLGGLIIGNSGERQTMIHATKPIQSVLLMVFFLSVGLLLDFSFIWHNFGKVAVLLIFITLGKTALNIGALHFFKQPWSRAFLAGLILSQMGEFAFVLVTVGYDVKIIDAEGEQLIVSLAALSLALSPLWLMAARRLHNVAPGGIESADELVSRVYAPQMQAILRIKESCKKFAEQFSSPRKSKAEDTKTEPDFDLGIDPVIEEASIVEDGVQEKSSSRDARDVETSDADESKAAQADKKSSKADQKDPKLDA